MYCNAHSLDQVTLLFCPHCWLPYAQTSETDMVEASNLFVRASRACLAVRAEYSGFDHAFGPLPHHIFNVARPKHISSVSTRVCGLDVYGTGRVRLRLWRNRTE